MKVNKRPLSLTFRVVLFVAVSTIFSLTFLGILIDTSIRHHFIQQDINELKVISSSINEALSKNTDSNETLIEELSQAVSGHHGVYYQVSDQKGNFIYANAALNFQHFTTAPAIEGDFDIENITHQDVGKFSYRVLATTYQTPKATYKATIAIDMSFHTHFLTQFRQSLGAIMIGAAVLVLLAGWFAVHQGLNPLRGLSKKMRDIQTNNFEIRLDETNVPIELLNMVQSFNLMLDRLQSEFLRLSNFSTDIAHELRTPLTNIITQTQVGLSKPRASEEYQELLFSNLEELDRLTNMVRDMLWLAKTQNGLIKPKQQILNSQTEIKALFEYFDALAEEANITFVRQGDDVSFYCDKLHFRQLLSNLLSNAIRYTAKGLSIVVKTEITVQGQVAISISNPGDRIPAEHLPYLFDRFYRPDKSRQRHSEGVGLGLAIVKAMVEANSGEVTVTSDDDKTTFKVLFNAPPNRV